MRVALVGVAAGEKFLKMAAVVNPAKQAYCRRFGYDFIHFDRAFDGNRPFAWSKIPAVLQVLPQYDWVLWHDTDTVLWNPFSIREYIAACGDACMLLQGDGAGLNSGVFLMRNVPRAHHFLAEAWRCTDLIHDTVWEQAAITRLFHSPAWRADIRYYDPGELTPNLQRCFFTRGNGGWDSLFLHLAGYREHRFERLTNLVQLATLPGDDRLLRAGELGSFLNARLQTGRGAVVSIADTARAEAILRTWEGWRLDVVGPWLPERAGDRRWHVHATYSGRMLGDIRRGSLDFVFLDAAHTAGGYLAELQAWLPKLRAGAVIAGRCQEPAPERWRGCCPGKAECSTSASDDANASIPADVRTWCSAQGLPLGVTTDWPQPIWYIPSWPGERRIATPARRPRARRAGRSRAHTTLH